MTHRYRPGGDGNEGVLCVPKSSRITGTSWSDCLVSYPGHLLGESYPSAEKQSAYSTVPVDWGTRAVVPVSILSMGQIKISNHLLSLKSFNSVQRND